MAVTPIANTSAQLTGDTVLTDPVDLATQATGTLPAASLPATAVTPGSYTNTDLTVDAYGRIIAASNGSGGAGTVTHTGTLTANAVILGNGSADVKALAMGTAGQVLTINAGATAAEWAASTGGSSTAIDPFLLMGG